MSADLSAVVTKLDDFSFDELLTLQEQITSKLRAKALAATTPSAIKPPLKLNAYPWHNWPPDATYRREEIYDDDERY